MIREIASGRMVGAEIQALDRRRAKSEIDLGWWNSVRDLPKPIVDGEQDKGWHWHKLVGTLRTQLGNLGFAWAAWAGNRIQGAILYQIGAVSELEPELPTLMIYRLASAPWNREWLRDPPQYAGIGSGLLRLAIYHSYRYGMGGRVTVEAYSEERVLDWYLQFGFQVAVPDDGEVCVLELPPEAATLLIQEG